MLEEFMKSLGIEDAVIEKVKVAATADDITPLAQEFWQRSALYCYRIRA